MRDCDVVARWWFRGQRLGGELFSKDYAREYTEALIAEPASNSKFAETLETYTMSKTKSFEQAFFGVHKAASEPTASFRRSCCRRAPVEIVMKPSQGVRRQPGSYTGMY